MNARKDRRHLVLYGINYAPEQSGIAPYTTDLAEHMVSRGWRVTVVTGMPHYPEWRIPSSYRRSFRRRETRSGVDVRRLRHYVPARQSALGRAVYEATFLIQAVVTRPRPAPACILGVVPSLGGGLAAAISARRSGTPLGILFQDLIGNAAAQSGMPGGGMAAAPARALETWAARRADRVAVVTDTFRHYLQEAGVDPARIRSIPNWSHVSAPKGQVADVRRSLGWPDDHQIVLHAGNMGFKQGLESVVSAARQAVSDGARVRFVLMGDGNERRHLESLASGLPTLEFLDPQPRSVFMDVLGAADVLLLNERETVVDMSLPSKITSYFLAGRPVVAAVPAGGSTATELQRSGGAYLVSAGDPSALLCGLQRISGDPALRQALVDRAKQFAHTDLDRNRSLDSAEQFIDELVSGGRR